MKKKKISPENLIGITAEGVKIRVRKPDSGWTVATFVNVEDKSTFTGVGVLTFPPEGEVVELQGVWKETAYGRQFQVENSFVAPPSTTKGLAQFLENYMPGIGPAKAKALITKFGLDIVNYLENDVSKLTEVKGITLAKANKMADVWKESWGNREVLLFLSSHNIPQYLHVNILHTFSANQVISVIQSNPYELTKVKGIGFAKADEIAMRLGLSKDSNLRLEAAAIYSLVKGEESGHTYLNEGEAIEIMISLCNLKREAINFNKCKEALDSVIAQASIVADPIVSSETGLKRKLLYAPDLYQAEVSLADFIQDRIGTTDHKLNLVSDCITDFEEVTSFKLSQGQKDAVVNAFGHKLSVLTGLPGSGKTESLKAIIYVAERLKLTYTLCAPTGRAARRMAEVTGKEASTIHRLLGFNHGSFMRDETKSLDTDLVIVDESSMPDLRLFNALFSSINPESSVVLIGDPNQLPAIGAGTVLRDVIDTDHIPKTVLNTIFRQAEKSMIIQNAHKIHRGELPIFLPKGSETDSFFMQVPRIQKEGKAVDDTEWLRTMLVKVMLENIPAYMKDPNFDPVKDIQVISPMNVGAAGANELNIYVRDRLNPNGVKFLAGNKEWRVGDRVMQTENDYELNVSNGDIGFIKSFDVEEKILVVTFYDLDIEYTYEDAKMLQLAYVCSIHKVQGSQAKVVIIIMLWMHFMMLNRNLLYTANTRAQKMVLYLSNMGVLKHAVEKNDTASRNSFLAQRLQLKG